MTKKICVIGAGASGLPAIKCCLDENLLPVCYERSDDIGGLWRYEADKKEGACVYKSIIINTSKEMMCYSDFPIPKEFANFMHNTKVTEYMRLYAKQFNLLQHIRFHTEVLKCEPHEDYESTGRWKVTIKGRKTNETSTEIFDGILVCIGHHAIPHNPCHSFPGFDKFKGTTIHSHSYKEPSAFDGKRVVVIGIGNSGGDISVELGKHANKVFLSTRRGAWVINRVGPNGMPTDTSSITRLAWFLRCKIPDDFASSILEMLLNRRFDHAKYGLKPRHRVFSQHATVNDSIPNAILSGMLVVKGNVKEFTENGVIFEDGTSEEIDAVIFATGYKFDFPFLDDYVIKVRNNECRLYHHMWPPQLQRGSLAVIGNIQPLGAINPISEMQCRWATRVFKGASILPPRHEMDAVVDRKLDAMKKLFYQSPRHTIQVDYIGYMDEVANEIGVKPNVIKLFKQDFLLGMKVFFGPCTPYQYRLMGPGSWSEARETIMTQDERILFPLSTRKVDVDASNTRLYLVVFFFLLFAAYLLC